MMYSFSISPLVLMITWPTKISTAGQSTTVIIKYLSSNDGVDEC